MTSNVLSINCSGYFKIVKEALRDLLYYSFKQNTNPITSLMVSFTRGTSDSFIFDGLFDK